MNKTLTTEQRDELVNIITLMNAAKLGSGTVRDSVVSCMNDGDVYAMYGAAINFPVNIGLTRVQQLKARLDLVKDQEGFEIEYSEYTDGTGIESLKFVSKVNSADYRCIKVDHINVPKVINNGDAVATFTISKDMITTIQSAVSAYASGKDSTLKLVVVGGQVAVMLADDNGDEFTTIAATTEYDGEFTYTYNADIFTRLMKIAGNDETISVGVGKRGMLSAEYGSYTLFIQPSKAR